MRPAVEGRAALTNSAGHSRAPHPHVRAAVHPAPDRVAGQPAVPARRPDRRGRRGRPRGPTSGARRGLRRVFGGARVARRRPGQLRDHRSFGEPDAAPQDVFNIIRAHGGRFAEADPDRALRAGAGGLGRRRL